jgi:DNA mismatch endonuclease (patch repair protein)
MDNLTKEQRRKNMQHIRSTGTLPERLVMRELKRRKIYFASYVLGISGKPDIVFRRKRIAVFIDSDFWHGHPRRFIMPKTNRAYWEQKIRANKLRDKKVTAELRKSGWVVIRLWEYDIKHSFEKSFHKILQAVDKS